MGILKEYKPIGITPFELVENVRLKYNLGKVKISYIGRLDPMAHGLMVLLVDKDVKNQEIHQQYDKTYKFQILFGVETDTYDVLGKILKNDNIIPNLCNLENVLSSFIGKTNQPYPPYSSYRVNKIPLWKWAKDGKLDEISIPFKEINIYSLDYLDYRIVHYLDILKIVQRNIGELDSQYDFRQNSILDDWNKINKRDYLVITCRSKVSSGTYIRSLSKNIGVKLDTCAIAFDIYREQVDSYMLE